MPQSEQLLPETSQNNASSKLVTTLFECHRARFSSSTRAWDTAYLNSGTSVIAGGSHRRSGLPSAARVELPSAALHARVGETNLLGGITTSTSRRRCPNVQGRPTTTNFAYDERTPGSWAYYFKNFTWDTHTRGCWGVDPEQGDSRKQPTERSNRGRVQRPAASEDKAAAAESWGSVSPAPCQHNEANVGASVESIRAVETSLLRGRPRAGEPAPQEPARTRTAGAGVFSA